MILGNNKKTVFAVGFIILVVIVATWATELNKIKLGKHFPGSDSMGEMWLYGDSPDEAAAKRAVINTRYGLFLILVVGGTAIAAYMFDGTKEENDSIISDTEQDLEPVEPSGIEVEKEIAELKAKLSELEKLKDNDNYEE